MFISIAKGYEADFNLFARSQGIGSLTMHRYQTLLNTPAVSQGIVGVENIVSPNIVEERHMNVAVMDVFSRLMMDRTIFLGTGIYDEIANIIMAQLLWMESISDKDIAMMINSPGGGVHAGNGIIDTMDFIKPKVNTIVTGMAASMGYMIAINGAHRSALKRSRLMQHQPLGGAQGQSTDMEITTREIVKIRKELYTNIAEKTGKTYEQIDIDCNRDYWMTAYEARDYGAIDEVLLTRQ